MEWFISKLSYNLPWVFWYPVEYLFKNILLTPTFFVVVGFSLCMERLFPARPNQKLFSVNFMQDFVWFFYETILHAAVLVIYIGLLKKIYQHYFSFLVIRPFDELPVWGRFLIGILLIDFLYWAQHWLNHKVSWFWQFHTVHHSQKEINFFTDYRYHLFEYFVRDTILTVPALILNMDVPTIIYFTIFRNWYTRFYHSNIRWNLGWLRYIFVTPQSHRIHHSIEIPHYDKNFGSLFSIWDYLFGTQYRGYKEYPETGIPDLNFPLEKKKTFWDLLLTPWTQLTYPFRVIKNKLTKK